MHIQFKFDIRKAFRRGLSYSSSDAYINVNPNDFTAQQRDMLMDHTNAVGHCELELEHPTVECIKSILDAKIEEAAKQAAEADGEIKSMIQRMLAGESVPGSHKYFLVSELRGPYSLQKRVPVGDVLCRYIFVPDSWWRLDDRKQKDLETAFAPQFEEAWNDAVSCAAALSSPHVPLAARQYVSIFGFDPLTVTQTRLGAAGANASEWAAALGGTVHSTGLLDQTVSPARELFRWKVEVPMLIRETSLVFRDYEFLATVPECDKPKLIWPRFRI